MRIQQPYGAKRTCCRFIAPAQYQTMRGTAAAFSGAIGSARIRRAQEAIETLSAEFHDWMRGDVTELDEAWRRVRDAGGNEPAFERLLLAALSIKGTAAMLGYPYSGQICASLVAALHRVSLAFIRNEKTRIACQQEILDRTTYRSDLAGRTRQPQALQ